MRINIKKCVQGRHRLIRYGTRGPILFTQASPFKKKRGIIERFTFPMIGKMAVGGMKSI